MSNIRITLIIVIIGFLLVIVLIGVVLFESKKFTSNPPSVPTGVPIRSSATPFFASPTQTEETRPTPTVDPPLSGTGGSDKSGLSPQEEKAINENYNLQIKVPLNFPQFNLRYEDRQFTFYATIYDPYSENLLYFRNWIKTNGYESIPDEKFVIVRGTK